MAVNDSESLRPKLVFPLFPLKAMETSKWHLEMDDGASVSALPVQRLALRRLKL
jgi:hypothetical protein